MVRNCGKHRHCCPQIQNCRVQKVGFGRFPRSFFSVSGRVQNMGKILFRLTIIDDSHTLVILRHKLRRCINGQIFQNEIYLILENMSVLTFKNGYIETNPTGLLTFNCVFILDQSRAPQQVRYISLFFWLTMVGLQHTFELRQPYLIKRILDKIGLVETT